MLTKTNYSDWALLMKVKLRARLLWTAIEKGAAVPPEMWPVIANKETAKEAWEAIATMRIGDDRVKKTSAQNLRRQFDSATFKEGESVEDYALRLNSMASTLTTLGDKVEETQVVEKIIRSVPQRFRQIVVAITMLLDVSTLTVADLTVGSRRRRMPSRNRRSSSVTHRGRHGRGRGRAVAATRARHQACRRCGKLGHWAASAAPSPRKSRPTSSRMRRRPRSFS
ncbi:unnamed protein product [Spirodela intermedia]|uniref:DUF4219 domain-containing protein n=1 Tax=Spirodela intermedia TaxID=51605 RepID=A0ABN7EA92_SPIIN|nr:unnamed protein product [Spirodela intermedia]